MIDNAGLGRLSQWYELAAYIGKKRYAFLRDRFPEDFQQIVSLASLEACALKLDNRKKEDRLQAIRIFQQIFYRAALDYGFEIKKDRRGIICGGWFYRQAVNPDGFEERWSKVQADFTATPTPSHYEPSDGQKKSYHRCAVELCSERGIHRDKIYGWLCHRHYSVVRVRKKRGWQDPYRNLATSGRVSPNYLPSRNRQFWLAVRLSVKDEEWLAMWRWTFGYTDDIDPQILLKARSKILN